MAISSSGMKIFKIAFQHVVENSCMVPIAPFSATKFSHISQTLIFTILDLTPKQDAWFSFLFWEMVWIYVTLKTVSVLFDTWLSFQNMTFFIKQCFSGTRFYFLDYFR